jgi:hypothetical protein
MMRLFTEPGRPWRARHLRVGAQSLLLAAIAAVGPSARADGPAGTSDATRPPSTGPSPGAGNGGSPDNSGSLGSGTTLALDPTAPQAAALPGGVAPAFGHPLTGEDWRFDFHGYITAPLNVGVNSRPNAQPGQSTTVLHAPPVVPDDFETFSHTSVVPMTYTQLNFSESNDVVSANVSVEARQEYVSESFLEPASQLGITDAFLSYVPKLGPRVRMRAILGAFTSRYGTTGEYDEGRYGMPLIARISGVGDLLSVGVPLGDYALTLEQGLQGQTNYAGSSITPDVWNEFANPEEGTTFVNHFHAGLGYRSTLTVGGHFINAQSHDDRATGPLGPDGSITVVAADVRLTMHRFGHFYFALASARAVHAVVVSRIISILNTPGGPGLGADYFGSQPAGCPSCPPTGDESGTLTIGGAQYDLSLARLASFPAPFTGDGPDVFVSLFGLGTKVTSAVPRAPGSVYGNGVTKIKFGAEGTYSVLPWLAFSARFDRVMPAVDDPTVQFSVISPRVIFRSAWMATDEIVLQYSHWFDGARTTVRDEKLYNAPADDIATIPDADTLSLSANIWW